MHHLTHGWSKWAALAGAWWCVLLQVHEALAGLMSDIHALSIKRCWTKAQQAATQGVS